MVRDVINATLATDYEPISMTLEVEQGSKHCANTCSRTVPDPEVRGEFEKAQRFLIALSNTRPHPEKFWT